ncbi:MAG: methionyl-tRNA formyltransferase [Flavobacteriaceae bacterium]
MKNLRLVFMGTPEFAVSILKGILDKGYNVVGVITAVDKKAGRGRKIHQSAVKKFALEQNLTILQPPNLKAPSFIEDLKALNANLQVVVAFRMLPKVVWQMPKHGTFNLHASLLPAYRGAAPINWAIINGETQTGVTTFFIDDKIDTGEIILQKKCNIKDNETAGELHDKLMDLGTKLVTKTIKKIKKGSITTKPQPDREHKHAPKIFKDTCKINWNDNLDVIYNKVRGLSPYPVAWTVLKNGAQQTELKIYAAKTIVDSENFNTNLKIGQIIHSKKELYIVTKQGFLSIEELQISGKRKMDVKSFLNGYKLFDDALVCD